MCESKGIAVHLPLALAETFAVLMRATSFRRQLLLKQAKVLLHSVGIVSQTKSVAPSAAEDAAFSSSPLA